MAPWQRRGLLVAAGLAVALGLSWCMGRSTQDAPATGMPAGLAGDWRPDHVLNTAPAAVRERTPTPAVPRGWTLRFTTEGATLLRDGDKPGASRTGPCRYESFPDGTVLVEMPASILTPFNEAGFVAWRNPMRLHLADAQNRLQLAGDMADLEFRRR